MKNHLLSFNSYIVAKSGTNNKEKAIVKFKDRFKSWKPQDIIINTDRLEKID